MAISTYVLDLSIRTSILTTYSFESYSALNNTLVIDIAHINHVKVSPDRRTAVVGAGIRLGPLYLALDEHNTTFIGGICPTVGLGGLTAAGGFNMNMRALGISVDHVQSVKVVTANRETLTASKTSHPDLFWAMLGGGGGTYGIALEYTLALTQLPRSSMAYIAWNSTGTTAFDVAKRFLDWAPKADPAFTSQVNVFQDTISVLGWYLGKSQSELQQLIGESNLLSISPESQTQVSISGNCNTDNSRLFGYTTFECTPDDQVNPFLMNAAPDPFSQYESYTQFKYNETLKSSTVAPAPPWTRFRRLSKSFFVQKNNLLTDSKLHGVIDKIQSLGPASKVWGEWHAWNISSGTGTANAFAWREQAYAHLEFQIHGSENTTQNAVDESWMADLEGYLRTKVG